MLIQKIKPVIIYSNKNKQNQNKNLQKDKPHFEDALKLALKKYEDK